MVQREAWDSACPVENLSFSNFWERKIPLLLGLFCLPALRATVCILPYTRKQPELKYGEKHGLVICNTAKVLYKSWTGMD